MRLVLPALAVCFAAVISGCEHAPGYPPAAMARPSEVTDFATLYNQNCSACHGRNGQNGPAIDLGNPEYQALAGDDVLSSWISGGIPGTEMPAFAESAGGMLSNRQIDAIIAGMRKQWSVPNAFGGVAPPPYEQPQTADPHRGQAAYQAHCASCHASSSEQITSPSYLALMADQQLRSVIIAGRPDIGQPDWRHDSPGGKLTTPLSAQEVDDIVAYLGSLRNAPAAASIPSTAQAGR